MKGCRPVEPEEFEAMRQHMAKGTCGPRNVALWTMGCQMGPRISELLQLRLRDVMEGGKIRGEVTLWKRYRKRKPETMLLPVTRDAKKALGKWIRELVRRGWSGMDDFLFQSADRGRNCPVCAETVRRMIRMSAMACGVSGKVATHSMRKTFAHRIHVAAMRWRENGQTLDPIQETMVALGHKDPASTIRYLGIDGMFTHQLIEEAFNAQK